jgi:hypothetical protein
MFGSWKVRRKKTKVSVHEDAPNPPKKSFSFWNLFRSVDDVSSFAHFKRRLGAKESGSGRELPTWLKTASLNRIRKSSEMPRKREYPDTPPTLPPKATSSSIQYVTPPPRRRQRKNRSGSQMSLFSISLEHRSRSMQSLLLDQREGYQMRTVRATPPPRKKRSATPSARQGKAELTSASEEKNEKIVSPKAKVGQKCSF